MRDPLNDKNPFLSEYNEWDLWCYQNAREHDDDQVVEYFEGGHPDWVTLDGGVDEDGWLIPQAASLKEGMEYSLGYYPRYFDDGGCAANLFCAGPMDDETKTGLLEVHSQLRAAYLLPIPRWLADAPPLVARFIPDGNFAVQGEPGCGSGIDQACFNLHSITEDFETPWSLYSPEGELLETGEPGEYWWQLYFTDFEERTGLNPQDNSAEIYEYGGIISAYDPESSETTISYTYDGQELFDHYSDRPDTDPRDWAHIFGPEIPLIHQAQQTMEPRLPCGMGIGIDDPAELDQSLIIATGNSPTSYAPRYINVKPIDTPGNPYVGMYEEWDRWIYDNHLMLCNKYGYNNRIDDDTFSALNLAERGYDGAHSEVQAVPRETFDLRVDDDGWLIPHTITQEMELFWLLDSFSEQAILVSQRAYCGFHLMSSGFMDQEMLSAYQAVMYQLQATSLPLIPAWLVDNPPFTVRFLPTGESVTYGELGTTEDYSYDLPWVHYSTTGEELGRSPSGTEWWEVTFPGFAGIVEELGGTEVIESHEWRGIIELIRVDEEEYIPAAVYSYTGVEMEIAEYDEMGLYFQEFPGEFLPKMLEAQLKAN